jgi:hypothetical protein
MIDGGMDFARLAELFSEHRICFGIYSSFCLPSKKRKRFEGSVASRNSLLRDRLPVGEIVA